MGMELTILMPCLNEAETLGICIRKARETLDALGVSGEILVADNGSTDNSRAIAEALGARVVEVPSKGYGSALRSGIASAKGQFVVIGDSDDSYDFRQSGLFLERLRTGHDLVMGCRMPSGGGKILPGAMPWKHRWIGNPVLTFIGRLLFKCPCHDFHCGMRGIRREAALAMKLRTSGMEFASEMVVKATLGGFRIGEVPVTLHKDGRSHPPHLRSWRDGWRHLRFLLLFSPRWLFLYPGMLFTLVGGAFFLRLWLGGPLDIGPVRLGVHTLEMAGLVLGTGWQMILFACFVRIFAHTQGFLPANKTLRKAFAVFNMERGLLSGLAVLLGGIGLLFASTVGWALTGFGNLDPAVTIRNVIAGHTFAALGIQILLFSLVFSYLGMNDDPTTPNPVERDIPSDCLASPTSSQGSTRHT